MVDRSREALLNFLDWVGEKGLMARPTAQTRKASANKVLSILEPEEAQDVTQIDLDEVMNRFVNLNKSGYSPESLKAYKSRVSKAISDFSNYLANPLEFKPGTATRTATGTKKDKKGGGASSKRPDTTPSLSPTPSGHPVSAHSSAMPSSNILPIPIRPDLTVRVQGLPFDLSQAEARRIANVIRAMAVEPDEQGG
ncbi:hypothetical protein [Marinicauda salina]|uniref:hypothetical protein n=1 Tax=Marinicauda salina TaxID=2135793 RepID=UPI0011B1F03D|nr:hypothetical protein [Marinicauda salina]